MGRGENNYLRKDLPPSERLIVALDETYIGGKEGNKHSSKKLNAGRGVTGKAAVVGAKVRKNKRVVAKPVSRTDAPTLQGFVNANVEARSTVYTDESRACLGMVEFKHESVKHSMKEFVGDMAHTNGIESFWAMLKRGYVGTYHKMSAKHLRRLLPYRANKSKLYGDQGGICAGCGIHFTKPLLEVDHIIARSKGGTDHINNLQLLCTLCNKIKGNRGMEYLIAQLQL